ncbi:MAG: FAD-linked oxidase C-terminal domain-containing protein [Verrucomicrobiota bacterium]|nr:FAD-linked oxidase C-terminal domain-containing protein [Verrucomicrobiota bacterium]
MQINDDRKYSSVTKEIVERLIDIVGEKYIIYNDAEKLEPFSHDEIPGTDYRYMPEVVIRPRTALEISKIMKLANEENVPVTPRGAGSGLSGGAVPVYGGIVLFIDRMNEILELDKDNLMIVVEPGVIANDINEFLSEYDLFYAGYPMSMETCYIGGNVAENAGGGKAVKYGVTSRYVLGLEVVTPLGEIVQMGGKLIKDVTGYNLVQLMTGSEGTLGIFTKIILKLMPLPKYKVDLLCLFKTSEDAINTVPKIMTKGGIIPTSIEFMDQLSVKGACDYLNETIPYEEAGAMLLITVDGTEKETIEREYELIGDFCMEEGAFEIYVADNPTTSERIWKVRRNIPEAYSVFSARQCGEDIVVPPASIAKMIAKFSELSVKYKVTIPCYGHAGDGNLHARIVSDPSWTDEYWKDLLPKILNDLYSLTKKLGGTISGEHGIGCKRRKYISHVLSEEYLTLLKSIKNTFDPNYILNPGKIF